MKLILGSILVVLLVGLSGLLALRFSNDEDTWICEGGQWVRHGNPANPPPQIGCGSEEIVITSPNPSPTDQTTETTQAAITRAFSKKYQRPEAEIIVEVSTDTGPFAKGSIQFKDELGGALWFGAKTEQGWELVHDGQGPMSCELAEQYQMPTDLVPGCIDLQNGNAFVEW